MFHSAISNNSKGKRKIYMTKIGIIGAMDEEVSRLKEKMEVDKIEKKAGMEFYHGSLAGKDVVIVKSGIG